MPIFRITSPTGVPVSACRSAKAICSSLYRVFFIRQPSLQAAHFAGFSLSSPGPLFGEDLITTSSGKDAKGGSQGAVGDRRAALCGANVGGWLTLSHIQVNAYLLRVPHSSVFEGCGC